MNLLPPMKGFLTGASSWSAAETYAQFMEIRALEEDGLSIDSYLVCKGSRPEITERLEKLGYKVYTKTYSKGKLEDEFYRRGETLVRVSSDDEFIGNKALGPRLFLSLRIYTSSQQALDELHKALEDISVCDDGPSKGQAFVLCDNGHGGYYTRELASLGCPLLRDNYSEEVVQKYDYVIKGLAQATPKGRLTILSGEPGTGKTFLVRGLIEEADGCQFVIVPPTLVPQLASPSFLPSLIKLAREAQDRNERLILFLEDAEMCLIARQSDNMSAISTLLNFGDGLLGEGLDTRIIATTNATKIELDKAMTRAGRLLAHIQVGALSAQEALRVAARLGSKKTYEKPVALAKIYEDADSSQ